MARRLTEYVVPGPIDDEWLTQLVGFFLADGCAMIDRKTVNYDRNGKRFAYLTYVPTLKIQLRADNRELLEDIHARFGGYLHYRKRPGSANSRPTGQWSAQGFSTCRALLRLMVPKIVLPAKKAKDLVILLEACEARFTMPFNLGDSGRNVLEQYHCRLRKVKKYSGG